MFTQRANRKPVAWLAAGTLLLATVIPAMAAADSNSDKWTYNAEIYLWGADIGGSTTTDDDIDLSFDNLVKNLNMAYMGGIGASRGKWSLFADTIYLDVSDDDSFTESIPLVGPLELDVDIDADFTMKSWITTLGGTYNVVDSEKASVNLVGGARYLWIDVDLKLDLSTFVMGQEVKRKEKESQSGHVWDGIVGVRGKIHLNDKWYMPYYADVGTGQSDLTWQALAGLGYRFQWGDVLLAYRYLDYEFKSDRDLADLNISGPALGAKFYF